MKILYRKGYKYQLAHWTWCATGIRPLTFIQTGFITLSKTGVLIIKEGYAWDGPSGPALDTPTFMAASLIHDALYQLMRMDLLPQGRRKQADQMMRKIALRDGMGIFRAGYAYSFVRLFSRGAADPSNVKKTLSAGK